MCYFADMTPLAIAENIANTPGFPQALLQGSGKGYPHIENMPQGATIWTFLLLIGTLTGVAILLYNFNRRFRQVVQAFLQFFSLNQFIREGNFIQERTGFILYTIFLLCISLFTYLTAGYFNNITLFTDTGISLYFKILTGYIIFFILKSGMHYFTGFLFETREAGYLIVLDEFIINSINGLILVPVLFIATYSPSAYIYYTGIGILALPFIYRMIRAVAIGLNVSQFSPFYLFLYLCSLEIVPVMVIVKVLSGNSQI